MTIKTHTLITLGTFLCCSAVTVLQAASSETLPPWQAKTTLSSAGGHTDSGIQAWYQSRMRNTSRPNSNLGILQAQADAGDDNAMYQLGLIYQSGRGVTQNVVLAEQLFEKSANAGNAYAQYALALLYRARGDQASVQRSIQLQQQSAQKGHVEAQYGLGMLYANGQYVVRDLHKARHWLQQSASRGNMMAQLSLKDLSTQISRQPVAQPRAQPARVQVAHQRPTPVRPTAQAPKPVFRPKPVVQHQASTAIQTAMAEPSLAAMPLETRESSTANQNPAVNQQDSRVNLAGMGVTEIRQAAEQGDMYAQLMLGALYEDGSEGVVQDHETALTWYLKAARQGYPKAQHNLALLYEDGRGTQQSYRQAAIWYKKAAKAGFSEAQNNLAVLYIMGNGVDEDREYAEQLLRQAVALGNANAKRNLKMLMEGAG